MNKWLWITGNHNRILYWYISGLCVCITLPCSYVLFTVDVFAEYGIQNDEDGDSGTSKLSTARDDHPLQESYQNGGINFLLDYITEILMLNGERVNSILNIPYWTDLFNIREYFTGVD